MKFRTLGFALAAVVSATFVLPASEPAPAPRYEIRTDHDPDGIGKFYMGREIAHVMGWQGAGWLERPEREKEERPSQLHPKLGLKPGDVVADIGAGSGYHTFRMAEIVGPKGKVFAVDVQPQMLDLIRRRMKKDRVDNVVPVQGTVLDPKLEENSIDLMLLVDVYHEFAWPYEMTEKLVEALKPGGRMVFVEFRLEDPNVPIRRLHCMTERQVLKEMEPFPLRHEKTLGHLPWQHVIVFRKTGD